MVRVEAETVRVTGLEVGSLVLLTGEMASFGMPDDLMGDGWQPHR